jgi:predicted ATPase/class 3 adenylate cyclase
VPRVDDDLGMRSDLPSGTVTFLFTDVEGSTRLLHERGAEAYAEALAEHRRVIRDACAVEGGVEVDTQGDAFFFAFPTAPGAIAAASAFTEALSTGPIQVRVGLHTGTPLLTEDGYVGHDVHRAARIAAVGHGGQVLVSSSTAPLVALALRDLGEHRLKDLSAPERVYQLGDGEFPGLKSLYRTNLPVPATPFLGRETELGEVCELLERDDVRLLTLTGAGGSGKTRLALQSAGALADLYPAGVYWVPLAPLRDPQLVLQGAAQAVGADDGLAEHITDKHLLLLLDNFEHLTEAATDAAALLATCPNLALLVTSREPLHVSGEQEYPVPPLVLAEAVDFFTARARAIKPAFAPGDAVPEICRRLDDLPLALELAAARVKALSADQILRRLEQRLPLLTGGARDQPERQRTLRATIEWSYELLEPQEQQLFARLAVFRGGCTLDAAEDVADADLDTIQSLVDKSLLRNNDERYWMLETIREYALERLEASREADEIRRRHAEHFLALAKAAEPHLRKQTDEWLDRIEAEHDNLRGALDRLEATGNSKLVLELAAAMCWFWNFRGYLVEGRLRVESALAGDSRPTSARATALTLAADFALDTGDHATSHLRAEEAVALHRELGDVWGAAYSLVSLGLSHGVVRSDWNAARHCFEEGVQLFHEVGDEHEELEAARRLAWSHEQLGDLERSRALHEDNVRRARATGDRFVEARSLGVLGTFLLDEGRVDDAVPLLEESYRLHRKGLNHPDRYSGGIVLCRFARALVLAGRLAGAAQLLACYERHSDELEVTEEDWVTEMNRETLTVIHARLDDAAFLAAWDEGKALSEDEAVELALGELKRDA